MQSAPSQAALHRYTLDEYNALDVVRGLRLEYVDGIIITTGGIIIKPGMDLHAMAGESIPHNRIAGNVHNCLNTSFDERPCEAFINNVRVRVTPTQYRLPDVVALCGVPVTDETHPPCLLNPSVIFEVLSPSTAQFDKEAKFLEYKRLASLTDYVLIAQESVAVTHYVRQSPTQWLLTEYTALTDRLVFVGLDVTLSLADIYRKMTFED